MLYLVFRLTLYLRLESQIKGTDNDPFKVAMESSKEGTTETIALTSATH